jgi:hypothetical protein
MNEGTFQNRHHRGGVEKPAPIQYTAKDFQLEVLGKLAEGQSLGESLEKSWDQKLEAVKDQRTGEI